MRLGKSARQSITSSGALIIARGRVAGCSGRRFTTISIHGDGFDIYRDISGKSNVKFLVESVSARIELPRNIEIYMAYARQFRL